MDIARLLTIINLKQKLEEVKNFIRSFGTAAKTDNLDAKAIESITCAIDALIAEDKVMQAKKDTLQTFSGIGKIVGK